VTCQESRNALHLYLDGELPPPEVLCLEAHLVECVLCRKEYETLLAAVESVRGAHRLFDAPEASRHRVEQLIASHHRKTRLLQGAIAVSVALLALILWPLYQQRNALTDRFAGLAAESHLRYSRGTLPLDVETRDPLEVSAWLSGRLPFHLTLPNYPQQPGQSKRYSLVGARLLAYGEDDVAYLAYRMEGRPISLLIASSARVTPTGGSIYQSGGLSFHTASYKGLRLITWTDKGLSYALVSDLDAAGGESCMICHGEESEQQKFAPLKPRL
jgi:anti-sigma factor RsiW